MSQNVLESTTVFSRDFTIRAKGGLIPACPSRSFLNGGQLADLTCFGGGSWQLSVSPGTSNARRGRVPGGDLHSFGVAQYLPLFVVKLGNLGSLTATNNPQGHQTAKHNHTASAEQDVRDPG